MECKERIKNYWKIRSTSFLDQRREELHHPIAERWIREITEAFLAGKNLKILDVGCGTGYFTILLTGLGHQVTGIDLTLDMIAKGKILAEEEHAACELRVMDAEQLEFEDESFDAVVSRNLTWTLPHPEKAYKEWLRVLKKDGILLNFDADYGLEDSTDWKTVRTHRNCLNSMRIICLAAVCCRKITRSKKNWISVITEDHTGIFRCSVVWV